MARTAPRRASELSIVERIAATVAVRPGVDIGVGDDAAVIAGSPPLLLTEDLMVDGVHFRAERSRWRDVGHAALAVNLSDIAAMGGRPTAAVVGLVLPEGGAPGDDEIAGFYAGMEALAERCGVTVAGGDISGGPGFVAAVTVLGRMDPGVAPILRSGALPGDAICVTGALGAAAAGLLVAEDPVRGVGLAPREAERLRAALATPEPRLAAGVRLAECGAHAMMDVSDGLGLDADRMARASGLTITIDLAAVPRAPGVDRVAAASGVDPDLLAATGGEDYELLVSLDPEAVDAVSARLDVPLTAVGQAGDGPAGVRLTRHGARVDVAHLGWEHM